MNRLQDRRAWPLYTHIRHKARIPAAPRADDMKAGSGGETALGD
jgi:hypothetical protein